MTGQYSYVRFRWAPADLTDLEDILSDFSYERREMPTSINDISPYSKYRAYLLVHSDTLTALVSQFRAILTQKEKLPFTQNDMKLREIILREFPKNTSTFFPWGFTREPSFETETKMIKED